MQRFSLIVLEESFHSSFLIYYFFFCYISSFHSSFLKNFLYFFLPFHSSFLKIFFYHSYPSCPLYITHTTKMFSSPHSRLQSNFFLILVLVICIFPSVATLSTTILASRWLITILDFPQVYSVLLFSIFPATLCTYFATLPTIRSYSQINLQLIIPIRIPPHGFTRTSVNFTNTNRLKVDLRYIPTLPSGMSVVPPHVLTVVLSLLS